MGLDLLLHLDLLMMSLLLVQLRPQTSQFLRIFRRFVSLSGRSFAGFLFVIQPSSVEFPPSVHTNFLIR
jgi:hypothetical protein